MAKVTIYSTPTCPYCIQAKDYLKEKNVEYEDLDVSVDQKAGEEMVQKSGQMGVPVIVVKKDDRAEEVMVGFDRQKLEEILGI